MKRTMAICLTLAVLGASERASAQFVPRPIITGRPIGPMGPIGGLPGNLGLGQNFIRPIEIGPLGGVLPTVENVRVDFGPSSARSISSPTQVGSHSPTRLHRDSQRDVSRQQIEKSVRSVPASSNREITNEKAEDVSRTVAISAGGEKPDGDDEDDDDEEGTNWWLWLVVVLAVAVVGSKLRG